MEFISDTVVLSRMQFALTASIHMLWYSDNRRDLLGHHRRTVVETNRDYYYHAFAFGLYALNFGVGVGGHSNGISVWHQLAPSRKQLATFLAVSLGLRHPGRLCWKQHFWASCCLAGSASTIIHYLSLQF